MNQLVELLAAVDFEVDRRVQKAIELGLRGTQSSHDFPLAQRALFHTLARFDRQLVKRQASHVLGMVTRARFERATPSFGGWCSIQAELPGHLVGRTGLEPVTSAV
jgi:hypothetical protein